MSGSILVPAILHRQPYYLGGNREGNHCSANTIAEGKWWWEKCP
jgi:hypothetical protein